MSSRPPNTIKHFKWRVEWLAQISAEGMIARLPGRMAFRLGECIGRLLWHVMPQRRRIVHKNLRIALAGEKPLDEIRDLARQSFIRSVANLVSAVHTAHMRAEVLESRVTVENPEILESAVRDGSGCLLLPPHMGNWEILSRITRLFPQGHELGALYRPLNNPYLDARLAEKRRSEGTRMFSKRDSLPAISRFLKSGGIIGVLADQRAGWQGVHSDFFGRLTRSSPLPSILIRRCKVPALSISVRTVSPGQWALKYHRVSAPGTTQDCMDAIEGAMRESILDVFWFQDRWKCYVSHGETLREWLGQDVNRSARHGHRALIWLAAPPHEHPGFRANGKACSGVSVSAEAHEKAKARSVVVSPSAARTPDGWEPPEDWRHADVNYELALNSEQRVPCWAENGVEIHRVDHPDGPAGIRSCLAWIDQTSALPLDLVISPIENASLQQACRREAIEFTIIRRS